MQHLPISWWPTWQPSPSGRILYHAVVEVVAVSSDIQNGKGVKEFISVCSMRLGLYQLAFRIKLMFIAGMCSRFWFFNDFCRVIGITLETPRFSRESLTVQSFSYFPATIRSTFLFHCHETKANICPISFLQVSVLSIYWFIRFRWKFSNCHKWQLIMQASLVSHLSTLPDEIDFASYFWFDSWSFTVGSP